MAIALMTPTGHDARDHAGVPGVGSVSLGAGDHASRPAASAVAPDSLYSCSDHHVIYQSNGSAWSQWFPSTGEAVVTA